MLRALWFLIIISLAVVGVVWLLDRPGSVVLDWQGYRLETSFAVLSGAAALLAAVAALLYRLWVALVRAPGRMGNAWRERRRAKGYKALTRGMVAVAAGDPTEAARQVKRADVLLNEPPLTLLLSAQAAQLNGDDGAAARFFQEMTENPETEFLGLRGLLTQALKSGDDTRALELARRAHRLQPKSDWVSTNLFDLQIGAGQWLDAQVTSDEQLRLGLTTRDANRHRKAVLGLQQGLDMARAGDKSEAARRYKQAFGQAPDFIPAALAHADALIAQGKLRPAVDVIAKTWMRYPHPDLVASYWRATEADNALDKVKATQRLTADNKTHLESCIALVRANLDAQLWGEARQHLSAITDSGTGPGNGDNANESNSARVCRLWADLEEAEHGDLEAARVWLRRAALADADPAWVCGTCGNAVGDWSAICGNCGGFDTFEWRRPPHVLGLTNAGDASSSGGALMLKDELLAD